jgi:hypothetical protein
MITPGRLRPARELRGLTQTALARQVGVHPSGHCQLNGSICQMGWSSGTLSTL